MKLVVRFCWAVLLSAACAAPPQKTYEATWASLDSRPTPAWWQAQKFSLFMHWGLYAVPAYCPVNASQHTCYAEHFWDTSHTEGSAQQRYDGATQLTSAMAPKASAQTPHSSLSVATWNGSWANAGGSPASMA